MYKKKEYVDLFLIDTSNIYSVFDNFIYVIYYLSKTFYCTLLKFYLMTILILGLNFKANLSIGVLESFDSK